MRLAMATLADAANVREGMISVLSAGVNVFFRPSFPSPLGATLALMIEASDADPIDHLRIRASIVELVSDGLQTEIGGIDVDLTVEIENGRTACFPIPVSLQGLVLPSPGDFEVRLSIGTDEVARIPFYAEIATDRT